MFDNLIKIALPTILTLIVPIIPLLFIIGGFVLIDTYYGIIAAKVAKEEIKSRRFSRVINKSIKYSSFLLIFHMINIYMMNNMSFVILGLTLNFTIFAAALIIINELFSIDEKWRKINGKGFKYYTEKYLKIFKFLKKIKEDDIDDIEKDDIDDIEKED
jgi:hypothetical protein